MVPKVGNKSTCIPFNTRTKVEDSKHTTECGNTPICTIKSFKEFIKLREITVR